MTTKAPEPQTLAEEAVHRPQVPAGDGERFAGYGIMGLPFSSGHYLAMRHFPASSIGHGYRSVWHRDAEGRWEVYTDAAAELSCPRYFGSALVSTHRTEIEIHWTGSHALSVAIPGMLTWTVELEPTPATRLLSTVARQLPTWSWGNDRALQAIGTVAGPLLAAGRLRLAGAVPNGQSYRLSPRQLWAVSDARAVLGGQDLGAPGPLPLQDRLGDFWLPQRGYFAVGESRFQPAPAASPTGH